MRLLTTVLASSLISISLSAEIVKMQSGWNLVGLSTPYTAEKLLENKDINKVYIFNEEFKETGDINPSDGIWIQANSDFNLTLSNEGEYTQRIDKIEFKEGWNLKSLPINSSLTPKIFGDKIIWKYSQGAWSKYSQNGDENYPQMDIIASGEGFWVKSNADETIYLSDKESNLQNFESKEKLNEYIDILVTHNRNFKSDDYYYPQPYYMTDGGVPTPTTMPVMEATSEDSSSSDKSVDDATSTNTQEAGVDEADILKHNGDKIFYVSNNWENNGIYVTTFDNLLNSNTKPITTINTKSRPNELYLVDNKLVVIYPNNYNFIDSWGSIDYSLWSESSKVEIYDVSDIANINLTNTYTLDGNIIDSRVTNNKLYLISRFMPFYKVEYQKNYVECNVSTEEVQPPEIPTSGEEISEATEIQSSENITKSRSMLYYPNGSNYCYFYPKDDKGYYMVDYDNYSIVEKRTSPKITVDSKEQELLKPEKTYAPYKVNQASFVTSVTAFDMDNLNSFESVSTIGNSENVYASSDSIYLVSTDYPIYFRYEDYQSRSTIYKFNIKDELDFDAKGFVDGRILNQFSLSEHKDTLRIATTKGFSWQGDTDNSIFTLQSEEGELKVKGELNGLGKEGETIKSVRFNGDKGFVVTFKQTDPFYTIDLSDVTNPKKVGELSISGFSSYLHFVDENQILSVGREADEEGRTKQLKLELFDVSDFANPVASDKVLIPEDSKFENSWYINSEAEYNHKAFTFRDSDKTLALPIRETVLIKNNITNKETATTEEEVKVADIDDESFISYTYNSKSYLDFYRVENGKINDLNFSIDADNNDYGHQRGVIFSNDSKDYGLFLSGDNLYLKEFTK